jgi:O-antigen/teichoic acid export membrane protein
LLIVFSLVSPYIFEDDLMGLLIATGLGYLIFIITGLSYLISSSVCQISINESFKIYKKIYYFGTPIFISYVSYFFYNKSSAFFLKHSNNLDDLAKLGISLQLSLIIYLTMGAYGKFYQPLILVKKLKAKIIYTYDYLILLTGLTLILIFYGQDLLSLIIVKSFFSNQLENSLILISAFFIGLKLIFDSQILLANKPLYSMYTSLIGGITVLVVLILIKEITILKIGVIMAISSFLMLFFSILLSKTSKFIYFDVLKICFFLVSIIITFQFFNEIRQYEIIAISLPIWYLLKRRNKLQHD